MKLIDAGEVITCDDPTAVKWNVCWIITCLQAEMLFSMQACDDPVMPFYRGGHKIQLAN